MIGIKTTRTLLLGLVTAIGVSNAGGTSSQFHAVSSAQAATTAKIGDLSPFRTIAVEVAALVDKGDLPGAKARIKDLETAWDDAEPSLKPRAPADWHTIDKALDRSLSALRASTPNPASCKQSLVELLGLMDTASGKV